MAQRRDAVRLQGERGVLVASIAQAKGKITETQLQVLQIDQDLRREVGKELAENRARTSELVEKRVEDALTSARHITAECTILDRTYSRRRHQRR